ncbi:uncharacterized protein LOC134185272 [Corticium candelabrum]|uniref:uncharacterized protein LOC134185272 n=1 Tax=Corticium candelabrum TaxID=121492 RepID=UPI002E265DA9|nr:uncharacterized protein LOC134185272 [Corticium candelabrum]
MINSTNNSSASHQLPGITSIPFHLSLLIFSLLGIIGNTLVLVWRCTRRKDSRLHIVSLLIINLSFSDLLFCIQYLLREIMLVGAVFHSSEKSSYPFTNTDSSLCMTVVFLMFASSNCVVLTAVAIALHTLLSVTERRWTKPTVVTVVAIGWMISLTLAGLATSDLQNHIRAFRSAEPSVEFFSLIVMYGCTGDDRAEIYPVIVTGINFLSSIICCFLYAAFCIKMRRIQTMWGSNTVSDKNREAFIEMQIRFAFIALLNLACWWPACRLYWYSYFSDRTVFKGNFNPKTPEVAFLFTIIVSASNPVLYTVSWKWAVKLLRRICFRDRHFVNEERY